jgi:hypothetical protein
MTLKDDDPLWEQHSGGDGHRGPEWGRGDSRRAAEFYGSLAENARLILDLLMDHPGQQVSSDRLPTQILGPARGGTGEPARHVVAGSLSLTGELAAASGRRLPFYWWKGENGSASWYAMKPTVAALFREARQESGPGPANAAVGTDWTAAEVAATVDDYLEMLAAEAMGQPYSKTEHRRALRQRLSANRTDSAIEYKHQNISAVMIALGLPYIRGYKPMGNFQEALSAEIQRRLQEDPTLLSQLQDSPTDAVPASPLQRTDPPQRAAGGRERGSTGNRPGRHPDYGLLHDENTRRGATGEQLVFDYERTWLRAHGRGDLADRVRWTAREDGDGLGYDVLSYGPDGHERYIEVKTTALGALTPFYLSSAELEFARCHLQSYALYRVYAVLDRPPQFFALQGNDVIQLELTPVTYRACLPAQTSTQTEQTPDDANAIG